MSSGDKVSKNFSMSKKMEEDVRPRMPETSCPNSLATAVRRAELRRTAVSHQAAFLRSSSQSAKAGPASLVCNRYNPLVRAMVRSAGCEADDPGLPKKTM